MTKSFLKGLVAAALGVALLAAPAAAQIGWSIGAGVSMPNADGAENGFHGMGAATFGLGPAPIKIRADVMYHAFDGASTLGVDGDAMWHFMPGPLSPYAIGGLSWGTTSIDGIDESESDFGWNLGGGLDFGISALSFFAEARYLKLGDGDGIIPVTVGLRF